MFFTKKIHSWYWYAFGALLFCLVLFSIAKFFMTAVTKLDTKKKQKKTKDEPMFI